MSFGQGGPDWGSGSGAGGPSTPDWGALAEEAERNRARRRRWLLAGGGALATVLVAGIVAVAVVSEGGGDDDASDKPSSSLPSAKDLPPESGDGPRPTFKDEPPPPPPPKDFIADAKRDTAALTAASLFPSERVTINGRPYRLTKSGTSGDCKNAAHAGLGPVLARHGCEKLFRATFTRDGLAVTVGIAAFQDSAAAAKVKKEYKPNLVALPGGGVPDFCRTVTCRTTANALGRYAYFTIAGRTSGKPSPESDKKAERAGLDGSGYAYARILQRGKDQSEKAAKAAK